MSDLINQMAREFCRWPLQRHKGNFGMEYFFTHAEALAMFEQIVGPKIEELERKLAEKDKYISRMLSENGYA